MRLRVDLIMQNLHIRTRSRKFCIVKSALTSFLNFRKIIKLQYSSPSYSIPFVTSISSAYFLLFENCNTDQTAQHFQKPHFAGKDFSSISHTGLDCFDCISVNQNLQAMGEAIKGPGRAAGSPMLCLAATQSGQAWHKRRGEKLPRKSNSLEHAYQHHRKHNQLATLVLELLMTM